MALFPYLQSEDLKKKLLKEVLTMELLDTKYREQRLEQFRHRNNVSSILAMDTHEHMLAKLKKHRTF